MTTDENLQLWTEERLTGHNFRLNYVQKPYCCLYNHFISWTIEQRKNSDRRSLTVPSAGLSYIVCPAVLRNKGRPEASRTRTDPFYRPVPSRALSSSPIGP